MSAVVEFTPRGQLARRQWCAMLAKLVSPSHPENATKALLDMLPAMGHLPDSLFSPDTLTHVAQAPRRQAIPAFDEITRALTEYRRLFVHEPRPALPAPVPGSRIPPTPEEIAAVSDLIARFRLDLERAAEARGEKRDPPAPLPDVTLKGEALVRSRAARGLHIPAPEAGGDFTRESRGTES